MSSKIWAQMRSGARVFLRDYEDERSQIRAYDIAAQLGKICRYAGACVGFYSVAEHSLHVARILQDDLNVTHPVARLMALLHDAAECVTGDIPRQAKSVIGKSHVFHAERGYLRDVYDAFGVSPSDTARWATLVCTADDIALATEARDIVHGGGKDWDLVEKPSPNLTIRPVDWETASRLYLLELRSVHEEAIERNLVTLHGFHGLWKDCESDSSVKCAAAEAGWPDPDLLG